MPSTITKFNSSVNISFVRFLHIRFCGVHPTYQRCTRNQLKMFAVENAIFGFRFFQIEKPYSSHHWQTLCRNSQLSAASTSTYSNMAYSTVSVSSMLLTLAQRLKPFHQLKIVCSFDCLFGEFFFFRFQCEFLSCS